MAWAVLATRDPGVVVSRSVVVTVGFSGETEAPQDTVEFLGFEMKGRELEI